MIPILLVHGAGCTGAVFSAFAVELLQAGFAPHAPTLFPDLRTPDNPNPEALARLSLQDYVDAMAAEVEALTTQHGMAPVLLGHSMGALIVQKLAERGLGAAAVLLTPAAPEDCNRIALAPAFTFWNIISKLDTSQCYRVWETGHAWGVANRMPKARHAELYAAQTYEPGRVWQEMAFPKSDPRHVTQVDETRIRIPVLTVGARHDRATPLASVRRVAAKYARVGGAFREYANHGHWLIEEPGYPQLASDVAAWLNSALAERRGLTAA